jgi:hypothetical protein
MVHVVGVHQSSRLLSFPLIIIHERKVKKSSWSILRVLVEIMLPYIVKEIMCMEESMKNILSGG